MISQIGLNHLVIKISGGTKPGWMPGFLEISGIERDVYLSYRANSLRDFTVIPILSESGEGRLTLRMELNNPDSRQVETGFELLDKNGNIVASGNSTTSDVSVSFSAQIENVKPWSAEHPNLYDLVMRVENEYIPFKVGFRRFEIKDGLFFVNGQPIKFKE